MNSEKDFIHKKRLGQNFLHDTNFLDAIVSDANVDDTKNVLEIGTGFGTLTAALAKKAKQVVSIEIDKDLKEILDKKFENTKNVSIFYDDFLIMKKEQVESMFISGTPKMCSGKRSDFATSGSVQKSTRPLGEKSVEQHQRIVGVPEYQVVANLPYYITSPIIFKFIDEEWNAKSLTIMVQKEVADRLAAKPSSKDYGIITAKLNAIADIKILRKVGRTLFSPPPNVDSAIVHIEFIDKYGFDKKQWKNFRRLVDCAFRPRRKMLSSNLAKEFGITSEQAKAILANSGINPDIRGEALSVEQFLSVNRQLPATSTFKTGN